MDPATADLVRRAKAGSADALDRLYERSAGRLLAYIRLRLGRELRARVESRDILQAALLKSFQHLDDFRGRETRSLMAWLASIAEREIRDRADYHRAGRRDGARELPMEAGVELPAAARSALTQAILTEEAARLERALEDLSPEHREVILLRKFEELSFREIGDRMGRSEDASRMLLARAMTALTLALEGTPR